MEFSERLSLLMEENKTSISELARNVGVSRQSVMRWLNGSKPTYDKIMKIAEYFDKKLEYFGITDLNSSEKTSEGNGVPIVGYIQAGYPVESFDVVEGYVIPSNGIINDNMFALRVNGDSMMPLVMDGDIIILNRNVDNANNKICAVTVDGESTLKRIKMDEKGVTLIPINPMFDEIFLSRRELQYTEFHIDGVLMEMFRKFQW